MPSGVVTPGTTSKGMPASAERFGLLPAASEHERIAAFEPDHGQAAARAVDQHGADFVLLVRVRRLFLADVDALGVRRGEVEQGVGREVVVEDDVGLLEDAAALDRDQFGVARAGADQVDLSCGRTAVEDAAARRYALPEQALRPERAAECLAGFAPTAPSASRANDFGCRRARRRSPQQVHAAVLDRGMRADRDLAAAAQARRARRVPPVTAACVAA